MRGIEVFFVHFIVPLAVGLLIAWLVALTIGDGIVAFAALFIGFWATLVPLRRWWVKRTFG